MSLHSEFLVHWTGKDFHKRGPAPTDDVRKRYVARLRDDCLHGLYMNPGTEKVVGRKGSSVLITIPRICFSEIRASQLQKQPGYYGKLGIGVHRKFVIERMGNPVIYVQNARTGVIVETLAEVHKFLENNNMSVLKALEVTLGFVKNMSETNKPNLMFYEEMEWRIVYLDHMVGEYITPEDDNNNIFRLKVKPDDIKLIVFPDEKTKQMALKDCCLMRFFNTHLPALVTWHDCKNF